MSSKTDIANQALARVGAPTIIDIDDTSNTEARVVSNVFEQCVRQLGRMHRWNHLKARTSLAQLATAPSFGWTYQYQLPTDCIRLETVNGYDPGDIEDEYEIEGRKILTDSDECKITYIQYKEDTGEYDPLFVEALALLIASKIAVSIRQDEAMASRLYEEFMRYALPAARKSDGNELRKNRILMGNDSAWIKSRTLGTGVVI